MAFVQAEIKLPLLERSITTQLYFPTDLPDSVGNKVKGVITLLHGLSNTGADWMMMTSAARYAADNGYILIAPNADNSFYHNMKYGTPFYTAITQLLPAQLQSIFKIPTEREKNFIAGLSMGGYGALRIALSQPERFAACGSFSGAVDLGLLLQIGKGTVFESAFAAPLFGENTPLPPEADLFALARKTAQLPKAQQPRLYCSVGKQDEGVPKIYTQNQNFRKAAQQLSLDYTYEEWNGVHEWNFWDRSLAQFIGFIQNSNYGAKKSKDWAPL